MKDLTGISCGAAGWLPNGEVADDHFVEQCDVNVRMKSLEERDKLPCGIASVSFAQLEELDRNLEQTLRLAGLKKSCEGMPEEEETWQAILVAEEEKEKTLSRYDGLINELTKLRTDLADRKFQDIESMVEEITHLVSSQLQCK